MNTEENRKERRSWWMLFLISVLGTAIGVGLTFAVSNRIENNKKEQAQRLTAMMVIHDIDETVERVKSMKDEMEEQFNATMYTISHLDQIDDIPQDTLILALNYIVQEENEFSFDMSKEKIFHSSPDTWQNLGSMKFIDNVQSFYFNRQLFLDMYNKSIYWQRPVQARDLEQINSMDGSMSVEQYVESYYSNLRKFLKEKMTEDNFQNYINYAAWRIGIFSDMIEDWIKLNNENKFLMSITDEEMEAYVNSINKTGVELKEENLIGTWKLSSSDEREEECEYRKDHTYTVVGIQSGIANMPYAKGKLKANYTWEGEWNIEGDSLIQIMDWDKCNMEFDDSEIIALPGRQDMLDQWLKEYIESYEKYVGEKRGHKDRNSYGACMDASGDKIELKQTDEVQYLKRKR